MWIFDFRLLAVFLAGLAIAVSLTVFPLGRRIWQGKRWSGGAGIGLLVVFLLPIRFFLAEKNGFCFVFFCVGFLLASLLAHLAVLDGWIRVDWIN